MPGNLVSSERTAPQGKCWHIIPFRHSRCRWGAGRVIGIVDLETLDQGKWKSQLWSKKHRKWSVKVKNPEGEKDVDMDGEQLSQKHTLNGIQESSKFIDTEILLNNTHHALWIIVRGICSYGEPTPPGRVRKARGTAGSTSQLFSVNSNLHSLINTTLQPPPTHNAQRRNYLQAPSSARSHRHPLRDLAPPSTRPLLALLCSRYTNVQQHRTPT